MRRVRRSVLFALILRFCALRLAAFVEDGEVGSSYPVTARSTQGTQHLFV